MTFTITFIIVDSWGGGGGGGVKVIGTFGPGIKLTYMYDVYKSLDSFALADADRSGMQGDRRRASYWLVRSTCLDSG